MSLQAASAFLRRKELLTNPEFRIQLYKDTIRQLYKDTILYLDTNLMQIELDFRSKVPIYVQIIDQIKHLIAIGVLRPDDQLPTVRQLAADLRVNFNTIARAYRLLDEEGLISTQHGRGTFILPPPTQENGEQLRRQDLEWLTTQYLSEAALLDYTPEEVQNIFEQYLKEWIQEDKPPQGANS